MATLDELRSRGHRVGLVTNCAPDVPMVLPTTELGGRLDVAVYSCRAGVVKPSADIYLRALNELGVRPDRTLYVGDGSDQELTGASSCGMTTILVEADLSNTYDQQRADVTGWAGPRIGCIPDVLECLGGLR